MEEQEITTYVSYNGLGRNPMIWGVPYMAGLAIMCVALLVGMVLGVFVHPVGWLFTLIAIPIFMFIRNICTEDDKAVQILMLETKWALIKRLTGSAKYHGGTLTIVPTTYGRRQKHVKRYFEKAVRG